MPKLDKSLCNLIRLADCLLHVYSDGKICFKQKYLVIAEKLVHKGALHRVSCSLLNDELCVGLYLQPTFENTGKIGKEKVWVGTAENDLSTVFLSSDFRIIQLLSTIFQIEAHAEITSYNPYKRLN